MFPPDKDDELDKLQQKRHDEALNVLTQFVSVYAPATKETADTRFTTKEICNSIADHTGYRLDASDIFELMQQMKYTYEATESLEFNWLLKK